MSTPKEEKMEIDPRYVKQNRSVTIADIYDALVEIITNCDDSYRRLRKRDRRAPVGHILIETEPRRNNPSLLIVRDKAEGMTFKAMREKLGQIGKRTSESGDRGFMARGIKDCTELGDITVESIVDDRYYACQLTRNLRFREKNAGQKATNAQRKDLGIRRNNGTVVTLECSKNTNLPRPKTLKDKLALHYALRDIATGNGASKIHVRDQDGDAKPVEFRLPKGSLVFAENFTLDGYPRADCRIEIRKSLSPLDDQESRTRKSGILIKDGRAIHECSLFEFESEPLAHHYYGHIECPHIARLLEEYDQRDFKNLPHPPDNPSLPIDPFRQHGLNKKHPFTKTLLAKINGILKDLVEKDRRASEASHKDVASEKTKRFLKRLAQLADRFLKNNIDSPEFDTGEESAVDSALDAGISVLPPTLKIGVGEERTLCVYIRKDRYNAKAKVRVQSTDEKILAPTQTFAERIFKPHPKKERVVFDSFKVKGVSPGKTEIIIRHGDLRAKVAAKVVANRGENERDFASPLEFERAKYEVAEGKSKILKLFAQIPEATSEETIAYVDSNTPDHAPVKRGGQCALSPVAGGNYAEGEIEVEGRALTDKPAVISARLGDLYATTKISVKERRIIGGGLRIEFTQQSLGYFRARWKDPAAVDMSVILIRSDHLSIKPYLGSSQNFEEQDTAQFRVLLAELVTEVVCSGILNQEMRNNPGGWEQNNQPHEAFDLWRTRLQGKISEFSTLAHKSLAEFFHE